LKLYAGQAKSLSGFDISWNIVNVDGFLSLDFKGAKRLAIDQRIRFAGADGTGINARGEELEKGVVSLEILDVYGVCIGEKSQTIALGEFLEEGVIVDWRRVKDTIPDFRELLEGKVAAKPSAEMQIPIAGSHSPFLPIGPTRIFLYCGPKVGRRERCSG
jgi:hypothetical protein